MSQNKLNQFEIPEVQNPAFLESASEKQMVRWIYNPANREAKTPCPIIPMGIVPVGVPFPVTTYQTFVENHTTDESEPPMKPVVRAAAELIEEIRPTFFDDRNKLDLGFLVFWKGASRAKIERYWRIVHPPISALGRKCPATDEFDLDTRDICPTCLLAYLESPLFKKDVLEAAKEIDSADGLPIIDSADEAFELADLIKATLKAHIKYASFEWSGILRDYQQGTHKKITEDHHYLRKNIHEPNPADREFELARRFQENNTATISTGIQKAIVEVIGQNAQPAAPAALNEAQIAAIVGATVSAIKEAGILSAPAPAAPIAPDAEKKKPAKK